MLHLRRKSKRKGESTVAQPVSSEFAITPDDLHERIARRAYELFEQRGANGGGDQLSDWIRAETEVLESLKSAEAAQEAPVARKSVAAAGGSKRKSVVTTSETPAKRSRRKNKSEANPG
ncbi:MAG TPA: DUF2934 domain-containing protein [Blastocatellia bacterium]|nr:DUF2934 domain-containing protein [Blastocatellia bacterium]